MLFTNFRSHLLFEVNNLSNASTNVWKGDFSHPDVTTQRAKETNTLR